MALIVEVEVRIMTASRHDPSVLVEASHRSSVAGAFFDSEEASAGEGVDAITREVSEAAARLQDLVPSVVNELVDNAAMFAGRVRKDLG